MRCAVNGANAVGNDDLGSDRVTQFVHNFCSHDDVKQIIKRPSLFKFQGLFVPVTVVFKVIICGSHYPVSTMTIAE